MKMRTKAWSNQIDGNSTDWANLPEPMVVELDDTEVRAPNLLVLLDMARVNHSNADTNTQFRVMLNDTREIGRTNTGGANSWNYATVSLHCAIGEDDSDPIKTAESIRIEVQYKTQRGEVKWIRNANGLPERRLTVINF